MQNRLLTHIIFVVLFAFAQIGIATHSVEHIEIQLSESHDSSSHSDSTDQHSSDFQCPQCVAQSHADVAQVPSSFTIDLVTHSHFLLAYEAVTFVSFSATHRSARAPPILI